MTNKNFCLGFVTIILLSLTTISAQTSQLTNTQQKLTNLNHRIKHNQHQLNLEKKQKNALEIQLSVEEKKISRLIVQQASLSAKIRNNNQTIIKLSNRIKQLEKVIDQEQGKLIHHVQCRYKIDTHQPIKWLLYPGDKDKLGQVLSYYRYLISARQNSIKTTREATKKLNLQKKALLDKIDLDNQLQKTFVQQKSELKKRQLRQQQILLQLSKSIQTKKQQLKEDQSNRDKLSTMIDKLIRQNRIAQSKPFASRRHHLPRPVAVRTNAIKPLQQGLAFYTEAGKDVQAIHSGKVVFSDWLKGYGLLLIIDHGHGYMTLYAHNQALLKRKGNWVALGDKIAEVGHSGGLRENGLYFEIRHKGKAISPINWLS